MPAPFAAILFVFLWSTGFIGAKYADPYAEPFTTLAIRFALAVIALAIVAILARAPWPSAREARTAFGIGTLLHGVYLGGVFWAIDLGLPAGPSALIVSLQPLLTALMAGPLAGERLTATQWTGIAAGFGGTVLVLAPRLSGPEGWPLSGVGLCVVALIAITLASAWQKRSGGLIDQRTGGVYQYLGGAAVVLPLSLLLETGSVSWTPQLIFALFWMVIVLSIGAVSLLVWLLNRGQLVSTVSLMYLVPASTAVIAFFLFDETLLPVQLAGLALSTLGVALVVRR